jgi:hypothetical protein
MEVEPEKSQKLFIIFGGSLYKGSYSESVLYVEV